MKAIIVILYEADSNDYQTDIISKDAILWKFFMLTWYGPRGTNRNMANINYNLMDFSAYIKYLY